MNYFPFHIGDYAAHTGHLEPMEDLAYMRLLQQYYLREGPLPSDIQATSKLVRMRSMAADVESVLSEFFTLTDEGWRHSRCDAEIEKMQDKQAKARASGIASANARKAYAERAQATKPTSVDSNPTDVERALDELTTDVQLPTPTPTPTPVLREAKASSSASLPDCPHEHLIDLFAKHLPILPQPRKSLWRKSHNATALKERWRWVLTECYESGSRKGTRMASDATEALAWFSRFFAHVEGSDFLTGRNGKFTACDLGWLVKADNFAKVLQGNYDNKAIA